MGIASMKNVRIPPVELIALFIINRVYNTGNMAVQQAELSEIITELVLIGTSCMDLLVLT
jgi:hypothetical protein